MDINELKEKYNIIEIIPLTKGWSKDKKYVIKDIENKKMLLRISSITLFEKKKSQFSLLKKIESLDILCSKPIEFGKLDDNSCYTILSYLDGEDGIEAMKKMSNEEAYKLGIESGKVMRKLHSISFEYEGLSWYDRYIEKMSRKIRALEECELRIPMQEKIISYYKDHIYLMKDRPLTICHGDYHLGNMIVKDGKIGIIDFDKNGITDPYDDLKPFCWNVMINEYFETGLINGYFNNNIPQDFFKILKFYTAESLISHLPWAMTFGKQEIKIANEISNLQLIWWNMFEAKIPSWYKGIIKI